MKPMFHGRKDICMKVVFLDIDGVLNSMEYLHTQEHREKRKHMHDEIDESKVVLLKQIVDAADAKIVLSSTWRELYNSDNNECSSMYKYLIQTLSKYGLNIMDRTPLIRQERPLEIKSWLENNSDKYIETFVSLDDDYTLNDYEEYGIEECLVKTTFYGWLGGLQPEHVNQALRILNDNQEECDG